MAQSWKGAKKKKKKKKGKEGRKERKEGRKEGRKGRRKEGRKRKRERILDCENNTYWKGALTFQNFMASEFRDQLSRHGSSVTRSRLMSRESGSSMVN